METVSQQEVALRLRAIMAHLGMGRVQDLADAVGGERSKVSNWLNGYNLPPVSSVVQLVRLVPGLTLDWVFTGNAGALPVSLAIRLGALASQVAVPEVQPEPDQPEPVAGPSPAAASARRRRSRSAT